VIGAVLALARSWSKRVVGLVLAFGAGALISAVSFELAEEGAHVGDPGVTGIGLAAGAATYYLFDGLIDRIGSSRRGAGGGAGGALALGAFLDGIPEQLVLGIGLAAGQGVSVGLLLAIFVSNLPEAIGSSSEMRAAGKKERTVLKLWIVVAALCALATVVGYAIADSVSDNFKAAVDGFAAGALLVMLIDSMIPDATRSAGRQAGLVTTLGFALSAALSISS
jgi:ZIP family zinc transporter